MRAKWFFCKFKFLNPRFEMTTSFANIAWTTASGDASYCERVRAKWFYCAFKFLNPTFKMTTSFANTARTTASTNKSRY